MVQRDENNTLDVQAAGWGWWATVWVGNSEVQGWVPWERGKEERKKGGVFGSGIIGLFDKDEEIDR